MNSSHPLVILADIGSVVAIVGAWLQVFTPLAALAAMVWYCIQIWESKTVVQWRRHRRQHAESLKRLKKKGLVTLPVGTDNGILPLE